MGKSGRILSCHEVHTDGGSDTGVSDSADAGVSASPAFRGKFVALDAVAFKLGSECPESRRLASEIDPCHHVIGPVCESINEGGCIGDSVGSSPGKKELGSSAVPEKVTLWVSHGPDSRVARYLTALSLRSVFFVHALVVAVPAHLVGGSATPVRRRRKRGTDRK